MPTRCLIDFPRDNQPRLQASFENPREILQAWSPDEVEPLLQKIHTLAGQGYWAVGMLAYEAARAFDPAFATHAPLPAFPLAAFAIFDQAPQPLPQAAPKNFNCTPWANNISRTEFAAKIKTIRAAIAAGDYYQTNFTSRLSSEFSGNAESLFRALTTAQPDGYSFFLDFGDWQIASVSPELFFAWNPETRHLTTRPMKGTAALDQPQSDLQNSAKDRAENLMIVDLLRNDLSRIAENVRVPELFSVQNLSTARQMTSTITGETFIGTGLADIFKALFPCGSITGAPKIAAMQAIRDLETTPRGAYCGAFGIVQPGGEALFSVGIRTVTLQGSKATCGIGSGITWDSNADDEWDENRIKQRFLWRATASFDLLETLRLENGIYPLLHRHVQRLAASARYFGFPDGDPQATLQALAKQNPQGCYRVRLLLNRHGEIRAEIFPLENNPAFVTVRLADKSIDTDHDFIRHKTTHRAAYDAFKPESAEIFDTLLYNQRGEITEFTRGNVAVEIDGKLYTPPLSCGLLGGTLRAEMLATGQLIERVIMRDDVTHRKIWFLNGLRGMIAADCL